MSEFVPSDGISLSVYQNKYARRFSDGSYQPWKDRVVEVIDGNYSLLDKTDFTPLEVDETKNLAVKGVLPFSGRHLQHGDLSQRTAWMEKFTNCSTAMFSFVKFWLLLKGSGVGRCYDSDLCRVNWDFMPNIRVILDEKYPDYYNWMESVGQAIHKYDSESEDVRWFKVKDSAEGWVKVIEILETAAFQKKHKDKLFIFDFSDVRPSGSPIRGQQNRPSSGPVALMKALLQIQSIKGAGIKPWKQAMFVDHYLASCVVLGGIRRSSRIAVKSWRDKDVIEFIDIKRTSSYSAMLDSANNSVAVDAEFWREATNPKPSHARRVFEAITSASYFDKTGEPGFLNVDKLTSNDTDINTINEETYISYEAEVLFNLHDKTKELIKETLKYAKNKNYHMIVNPCGEIPISIWGGYCVIADVCLAKAENLDEIRLAIKRIVQFLIRVNLMPSLYKAEVDRTNRIGVSLTGIHEFAYTFFGYSFRDLLDENKTREFWHFIKELSKIATLEAHQYSQRLGLNTPHTSLTLKPSGTISKVMNCTEAAHLAAVREYIRWVQYHINDPQLKELEERGYLIKDISAQYTDHMVVGFPTRPKVVDLMKEDLVTSNEASLEEHYKWLQLLEKYWLGENKNGQVSYTIKYDQDKIDYLNYIEIILKNQPKVKACSILPQEDTSSYIYLPEEPISSEYYDELMSKIDKSNVEGYDAKHIECDGEICPIEIDQNP